MPSQRFIKGVLLGGLVSLLASAEELVLFYDVNLQEKAPLIRAFENPETRINRSNDGKTIYIGPTTNNTMYFYKAGEDMTSKTVPAKGEVYFNSSDEPVVWMDGLDKGIHFKDGTRWSFSEPFNIRFGVSYDATFCYLYSNQVSRVFSLTDLQNPYLVLTNFYMYKIVSLNKDLYILGFERLYHEPVRRHLLIHVKEIAGKPEIMKRVDLPEEHMVLDMDPYSKRVLFMDQQGMLNRLFEYHIADKRRVYHGVVDFYAFYVNVAFLH